MIGKAALHLFLVGIIPLLSSNRAVCQNPAAHWQQYLSVEQAGFSTDKLNAARRCYDSLQSSAFMVVQGGKVVVAWGNVDRRFIVHSVRKSLLNSLYGIAIANGTIDTNLTLAQIPITDRDTLSALEQSAKIVHLLRLRSGVYHRAAAEPDWVKEYRPKRNSHPPDSFFFYNNWDFNALGTIYERMVHTTIYEGLFNQIAVPLQMEDYRVMDGEYFFEHEYSDHPAYHVKMSARDLARYGQLFLQRGTWNNRRILSEKWVETSVYPHSKHGGGTQIGRWYGYLWGVSEYYSKYRMYFASGVGGQFLAVLPAEDLIIVNLSDTYLKKKVLDRELIKLFDLVLGAKTGTPSPNPDVGTLEPSSRVPTDVYSWQVDHSSYIGTWTIDGRKVSIIESQRDLVIKDFHMNFRLLPLSPGRFFVEDIERLLNVEFNEAGYPSRFFYDKHETLSDH